MSVPFDPLLCFFLRYLKALHHDAWIHGRQVFEQSKDGVQNKIKDGSSHQDELKGCIKETCLVTSLALKILNAMPWCVRAGRKKGRAWTWPWWVTWWSSPPASWRRRVSRDTRRVCPRRQTVQETPSHRQEDAGGDSARGFILYSQWIALKIDR